MSDLLDARRVRDETLATLAPHGKGPVDPGLRLSDVDSFTVVEMVLALEDRLGIPLLAQLGEFAGTTFGEFAEFVVSRAARPTAEPGRR